MEFRKIDAEPGDFATGVLVGTVEITGCKRDARRGCYAFLLESPRRLARLLKSSKKRQPIWWRPF
jgi:hypothetical protein